MNEVIGLVAVVSWIYSVVIIYQKTKDTTPFEKTVLITGLVTFILLTIGVTSK